MIKRLKKIFVIITLFLSACSEPEVPGGEITVINGILDKEYNSYVIDQLMLERGATSYSVVVKPNQRVVIPYKNIRSMRFTRDYKDYSMIYIVECPPGFNKKIIVQLIDVHTNKVGGGCKLVKRGKREEGSWVKWE
jgi:hypothetical protein